MPLYQRALAIKEKVLGPEHTGTATSLNNLAALYDTLGQYDKALPLYQRALAIREKALGPEHNDTASSLNNLAWLYDALGQYDKALPLYQRALAIKEKVLGPEHAETAVSLNNIAYLYDALGQYDKALPLYQRALVIREKVLGPEHTDTAHSFNNIAALYNTTGQYDKALPLYQRALAIQEKVHGPEHIETAISLNNLAFLYDTLGQYDKSLPLYQRALAIREKVLGPEHADTADGLGNLASLYETLGQYEQALALFQRALAIKEKVFGPEHVETARGLNNLAATYESMGQYDKALPLHQRALAIKEKALGSEHINTALSLNNLAALYDTLGQYDKALPLYQRALAIREKVFGYDHADTASSLSNLALLYNTLGQNDKALALYQRAYVSAKAASVPSIIKTVQGNLGSFYAARSNTSTAIFYLKGAVNTMQSIRAEAKGLDRSMQKSLLKKNEGIYKQLAQLLVSAGRLAEAQQVLHMLKEDEYFDFIRRDARADARSTSLNYSGAERPYANKLEKSGSETVQLVEQLNALNKQAKLGLNEEETNKHTTIRVRLAEQEDQTLALLDDISKKLPVAQNKQLAQQRSEQAKLAAGVQKQLAQLGRGVILIQYLLLGDKMQILLTDSKRQVVREVALGETTLYPKLVALRKVLEDPRYDPRPLAQELYQSLITPIEADIKNSRTLMLSLDGALRYIPFAALYDGKHYLVERYQLALYTAAAKDKLLTRPRPQWRVSGLGVTQAHPGFIALPGVKDELAGIVGKEGLPGETHLDQEFTAHQMRVSLKQGNPVLHLASHFQFTPGTEADSYLLLGDGSHLSLKDIRQGDYPFARLDLLTLSACATAMHGGQESNGKEVEGFGALAQNKGAKGVLATLWPIADESTAQLMQTLYHGRQQRHLNKAEALRQAQLALLRGDAPVLLAASTPDKRSAKLVLTEEQSAEVGVPFDYDPDAPFAHPFFWAPFILMGNWL